MIKNIYIVGAGQLGSRHLQALKSVKASLQITVIDPSEESLKIAKERYDSLPEIHNHKVEYCNEIPESFDRIDIAIIASNSDVRRSIIETLLANGLIEFMILEKLLFDKKEDYYLVNELFNEKNVKAWVDCSMRTMPFYYDLKSYFDGKPFVYIVTGSKYGLITNVIHFIDHISYLSDCLDYKIDTSMLHFPPIQSKRKGFLELNGSISVKFSNGSLGFFTCFPEGSLPVAIEIISGSFRVLSREWEGKAWFSEENKNWVWNEVDAEIPFQSRMTTEVVEDILKNGTCSLVKYRDSMKLHIALLEGLKEYLNSRSLTLIDHYPFT